jgi:hypothetical protein
MSDSDRNNPTEETEPNNQGRRDAGDPLVQAATGQRKPSRKREPGSASLYDDAISERTTQKKWKFPVWPVIFGLVAAGMVFSFISQPSSLERAGQVATEGDESELAKVVEEVKAEESASGEGEVTGSEEADTEKSTSMSGQEPPEEPVQQETAPSSSDRVPVVADSVPPASPPATASRNEEPEQPAEADIVEESTAQETAGIPGDQGLSSSVESDESLDSDEAVSEPEPDPGPPPEVQEAFDRLLSESEVAGKLVWGDYSTLQFIDWRVVQQTDREFWFDLTGKWTGDDREVHFIWALNREDGKVRPLSQEARNLEATARSQ